MAKVLALAAVLSVGLAAKLNARSASGAAAEAAKRTIQSIFVQFGTEATPGVEEKVASTLKQLKNEVKPAIVKGHRDTQVALDTAFEKLKSATSTTLAQYATAKRDDNAWVNCVEGEANLNNAVDQVKLALETFQATEKRICDETNTTQRTDIDRPLSHLAEFSCKFQPESCQTKLQQYRQTKLKSVMKLKEEVASRVKMYQAGVEACNKARSNLAVVQNRLKDAEASLKKQRSQCVDTNKVRLSSICSFGSQLQSKCALADEFLAVVKQVNTPGTVFSAEDRNHEFLTSSIVSCTLQDFVDKRIAPTDAGVEACTRAMPSMDELNLHYAEFRAISETSTPSSCTDERFAFSDASWATPAGKGTEYQKITPFSYEFTVDSQSRPFDVCSVASDPVAKDPVATDPCKLDDASCECFEFRDSNFCTTCDKDCGPCKQYCKAKP